MAICGQSSAYSFHALVVVQVIGNSENQGFHSDHESLENRATVKSISNFLQKIESFDISELIKVSAGFFCGPPNDTLKFVLSIHLLNSENLL